MMPVSPVMMSIGPVISSLVTVDIVKPVPTQVDVMTKVALPVPAMKIGVPAQPVRIMVAVPDDVVPGVCNVHPVMTSMCDGVRHHRHEYGARENQ
jgi:hypothetical protein